MIGSSFTIHAQHPSRFAPNANSEDIPPFVEGLLSRQEVPSTPALLIAQIREWWSAAAASGAFYLAYADVSCRDRRGGRRVPVGQERIAGVLMSAMWYLPKPVGVTTCFFHVQPSYVQHTMD
jgi:hypothetical protein